MTFVMPRASAVGIGRASGPPGPDNRLLVAAESEGLVAIYWPFEQRYNAWLVANCESGWWTGAHADVGEDSRGVFQLNVLAHPELAAWNLYDPQINAYFAYQLWQQQGWSPWTCAAILGIV